MKKKKQKQTKNTLTSKPEWEVFANKCVQKSRKWNRAFVLNLDSEQHKQDLVCKSVWTVSNLFGFHFASGASRVCSCHKAARRSYFVISLKCMPLWLLLKVSNQVFFFFFTFQNKWLRRDRQCGIKCSHKVSPNRQLSPSVKSITNLKLNTIHIHWYLHLIP